MLTSGWGGEETQETRNPRNKIKEEENER